MVRNCQAQVNCHIAMSNQNLTCPEGTMRRDKEDWHNPFGSDWSNVEGDRMKEECCIRNCDMAMTDLQCPAGTKQRSKDDWHLVSWNIESADEIKDQCCRTNCHIAMSNQDLTCPEGTMRRDKEDWHNPFGSDWSNVEADKMKEECCMKNCFTEMAANGFTCDGDLVVRHKFDFHSSNELTHDSSGWDENRYKSECCEEKKCWSALEAKDLTCEAGSRSRDYHDWHKPWGDDWEKSDAELKQECCYTTCHSYMTGNEIQCPSGTDVRPEHDKHNPFGKDWSSSSVEDITGTCCGTTVGAWLASSENVCPESTQPYDAQFIEMRTFEKISDEQLLNGVCHSTCYQQMSMFWFWLWMVCRYFDN